MCYRPSDSWNGEHITHKPGRGNAHDVVVMTGSEIDVQSVDTDGLKDSEFNLLMNASVKTSDDY
jgi:hypothetical protein